MQVSAHKIVSLFGIDALSALYSYENQYEIEQCRFDWRIAHTVTVELKSFNDGNNIFEIEANLDTLTAYRTDSHCDVTDDYKTEIFKKYIERDDKRKMFGIGELDFELLRKLVNG